MAGLNDAARQLRLLALDVDGVLTDGRIVYGNDGEEFKSFCIKDGLGIKLVQRAGLRVALITGRNSAIVARRASELGIEIVVQGREDKLTALRELCDGLGITPGECAYMGDDLPDLAAIRAAGLGLTVSDAAAPVLAAADWVSVQPGGAGAVREACEMILAERGDLDRVLADYD